MRTRYALLGTFLIAAVACGQADLRDGADSSANFSVALSGDTAGGGPRTGEMTEIVVTVERVTAQMPGHGWITLSEDVQVVDVLRLDEHAVSLGIAELPEGQVNQIRLHLASEPAAYVVTDDGETHPLRVPSGEQSGIKLIGPWTIAGCGLTTVIAELSGHDSILVVGPGHGREYILRPVIRSVRVEQEENPDCDSVTPGDDPAPGDGDVDVDVDVDVDGDGDGEDAPGDDDGQGNGDPEGDDGEPDDDGDPDDADTPPGECVTHDDCDVGYCLDGLCVEIG